MTYWSLPNLPRRAQKDILPCYPLPHFMNEKAIKAHVQDSLPLSLFPPHRSPNPRAVAQPLCRNRGAKGWLEPAAPPSPRKDTSAGICERALFSSENHSEKELLEEKASKARDYSSWSCQLETSQHALLNRVEKIASRALMIIFHVILNLVQFFFFFFSPFHSLGF